jgi:uncharacterized lipoprotein YmbA
VIPGRIARLILMALTAAQAVGCTSASSRFYTLNSTATSIGAAPVRVTVMVGPVSIPASVDRPEFVVQVASNRVEVDEFNRWAAPLNESIARAVAEDLAVQLGTPDVVTGPMANFNPAYRIAIDVQRFESIPGEAALVEAVWTVRRTAGGETRSGRSVARETVEGQSFDAVAAAHSRAIAKMSGDITAAIRSEADEKP